MSDAAPPRILVVDDEPQIHRFLRPALEAAGHAVERADTAAEGLRLAASRAPDLVLLDLGLPDLDGQAALARLRRFSDVPVIVLSARDREADKIAALDGGADDYVVKPVDLDELAARLRALVRRAHGQADERLAVQDVELDPAARTVSRAGVAVALSTREFDLLHALLLDAGRVLSREQLEQRGYGWGQEVESNAIEFLLHHLRRKLGAGLIETVRGVGYTVGRGAAPP
jgi:two-component system OmpR family response regulator/two-component system response regulator QseB